jgi:parallel beta-helix repeat protein
MRTLTWNLFATIRMATLGLGLLAAISIPLLWASPTRAGTTLTSSMCPVVIAQSGEYDLATDVGPCPPGVDGIVIQASAVTLRLNGHTISGTATSGTCNSSNGIRVGLPAPMPMLSQVRVLGDGTISNFSVGFRAENSAGSFVKFLTVTAQCFSGSDGFLISAPGGQWKLQGNVVREPAASSIGIFLGGVDDNDLVRNDVNNSIFLVNSSNNTVVNNTASDNMGGIFVFSSTTGSNNNEIHANTTTNNASGGGLTISSGSSANNITGNKSFNNNPSDMEDDNPNCDSNKWEGNQFGTANQPCIH